MVEQQLTTRRRLSRARVLTIGALSALTAAGTGLGLVARADPGDPPGTIRTIAGVTTNYRQGGFSGDGGKASDAQLYNPRAVAFSKTGEVFIGDALNHRIRKIDKNGIITTVAGKPANTSASGSPTGAFGGDGGPATEAQLNQPHGVAVDSKGNVYIADSLNNRIRKIDAGSGKIDTILGSDNKKGRPEGPAETAVLKFPKSLYMTPDDVLYICNTGGNTVVKLDLKASPLNVIRVAGNLYNKRYGGDGKFATDAQLNTPQGVWVVKDGTVFISDSENNLVRKVTPDGKITTIAGDTAAAQKAAETNQYPIAGDSAGDGGPATSAHLNGPRGISADDAGNIYIAEEQGARIRRIDPSGIITTIAGTGTTKADGHDPHIPGDPGPAPALEAQFNTMHDLNLDKDGNLWIADSKNNRIRMVTDPAHAPAGNVPAETAAEPSQQPQPQNPPPAGDGSSGSQATTSTTAAAKSEPSTTTPTGAAKSEPSTTTTTGAAKSEPSTTTTTAGPKAEPSTTTTTTAAAQPSGAPPADDTKPDNSQPDTSQPDNGKAGDGQTTQPARNT
jgi:sugar lactone lactonase YvrE